MENSQEVRRLSKGTIAGYGVAGFGNGLAASLFYLYFLYFLTTVAGISPAIAGTISLIAVLWDAVNDPIIGYMSDTCKSKYGRRRPFMISGMIPLFFVCILMFVNVPFSGAWKAAYYIVINIAFWWLFTYTDVPTIALGDSLDGTYDDKTKCRMGWAICMQAGSIISQGFPLLIVGYAGKLTGSVDLSWVIMAGCIAILTFLAYFIGWNATRGKEVIPIDRENMIKKNFLEQYINAFMNKSMRYSMLGVALIYLAFNGAAIPTMAYMLIYNLGISDAASSFYMTINAVAGVIGTVVIGAVSVRYGKKLRGKSQELAIWSILYGILSLAAMAIGTNKVVVLAMFFISGFTMAAFFLHAWNLGLDAAKVEQYKTGEDKGCEYVAFIGFAFKVGGAIGMWIVGIFLQMYGFDGELAQQSASALHGIETVFYVVTGIFVILGGFVLLKSPMTRKKLDAVIDAIERKERGEAVSEEEFADLL